MGKSSGNTYKSLIPKTFAHSLNIIKSLGSKISSLYFQCLKKMLPTDFWLMFPFYTLGFLVFSGVINWEHWPKMGCCLLPCIENFMMTFIICLRYWKRPSSQFSKAVTRRCNFNPFLANVPILYPMETPKNARFFGAFKGYKMRTLARYGLTCNYNQNYSWNSGHIEG